MLDLPSQQYEQNEQKLAHDVMVEVHCPADLSLWEIHSLACGQWRSTTAS